MSPKKVWYSGLSRQLRTKSYQIYSGSSAPPAHPLPHFRLKDYDIAVYFLNSYNLKKKQLFLYISSRVKSKKKL
jgi:hypothetical protein